MKQHITNSIEILRKLQVASGLFRAAPAEGTGYHQAWIRDTVYQALAMEKYDLQAAVKAYHGLLDALLKYATVGNSGEEPETVDLNQIIEIALVNLKVRIEETEATVEVGKMPKVRAYSSQLTQLFQNLIGNAVKFRKPDVKPVIRVVCHDKGDRFLIKIIDNGIGIPADAKSRVFDIFQRLHTRTEYEGTGIGLAICQKIVQRHGGEIGVDSEEGKGATFYFSLMK